MKVQKIKNYHSGRPKRARAIASPQEKGGERSLGMEIVV